MSPWQKLLERPHAGDHFVQLYEAGDDSLASNVGQYLGDGLLSGGGALVVVTPDHQALFSRRLEQLGADVTGLVASERLIFLDAHETMAQFMVEGQPDWVRFENTVQKAMGRVRSRRGEGLRAYGEMVGILWQAKQFGAAVRLEQFWNRILEQSSFSLYSAYSIDVFGKDYQLSNLEGVLCTHTHLVPTQLNGSLETALDRSMDEILGVGADALRLLIKSNYRPGSAVMPDAENIIFWLRKNLPERADEIISLARSYYQLLLHPSASPIDI